MIVQFIRCIWSPMKAFSDYISIMTEIFLRFWLPLVLLVFKIEATVTENKFKSCQKNVLRFTNDCEKKFWS